MSCYIRYERLRSSRSLPYFRFLLYYSSYFVASAAFFQWFRWPEKDVEMILLCSFGSRQTSSLELLETSFWSPALRRQTPQTKETFVARLEQATVRGTDARNWWCVLCLLSVTISKISYFWRTRQISYHVVQIESVVSDACTAT